MGFRLKIIYDTKWQQSLDFVVYSQASAMGGTFNICQCSIVVWIVAKLEIKILHSRNRKLVL